MSITCHQAGTRHIHCFLLKFRYKSVFTFIQAEIESSREWSHTVTPIWEGCCSHREDHLLKCILVYLLNILISVVSWLISCFARFLHGLGLKFMRYCVPWYTGKQSVWSHLCTRKKLHCFIKNNFDWEKNKETDKHREIEREWKRDRQTERQITNSLTDRETDTQRPRQHRETQTPVKRESKTMHDSFLSPCMIVPWLYISFVHFYM